MRLPQRSVSLKQALEEFDVWITPSLGEITDTDKYKQELRLVSSTFETMGAATNNFASVEICDPDVIAETIATLLETKALKEREEILPALASTLFAVTGKSDNNFKCQFPLFLRDQVGWSRVPVLSRRKGQVGVIESNLPRVLKSDTYMSLIAHIGNKDNGRVGSMSRD